jgi:serine/threonine protein kinase
VTQDVRSGPGGPLPQGLVPGEQLAGYQIQEPIGRGGMAIVYRALDLRLGRLVALKVLAPNLSEDEAFRQRFIRESRAAAGVDHPHIIPVFEAGEAAGMLFIAMRYVSHGDVRTLIDTNGPLDADRVISITSQVASALDCAHENGLVHRDVKPGNMLLSPASSGDADHVYLSDFGLSKHSLTPSTLTSTGQFLGTLDYVSPEQIQGHPVDGRADQYALACTVVEMFTGKPPFQRDDTMALMWAQLEAEPPRLTDRRPDLPPAVNQVIATAMGKWPDSRYPTCREFAAALAAACLPEPAAQAASAAGSLPPPDDVPLAAGSLAAAPLPDVPLAEQTIIDLPPASSGGPGWDGAGWSDAGWSIPAPAARSAEAGHDPTWLEPRVSAAWPPATPAGAEAELTAASGWRDGGGAGASGHVPASKPVRQDPAAWARDNLQDGWPEPVTGDRKRRSRGRGRGVLIGVLIALVGLAGVAGIAYKLTHNQPGGTPTPPTVTTTVTPTTANPRTIVHEYFAAINHHRWLVAWRLVGEKGTYAEFRDGFRGTLHDTLSIQSVKGNVVTASLVARQTDGTVKDFAGTYTVDPTKGIISSSSVQLTS